MSKGNRGGRKPKPTVLKLIAGVPGHRALPKDEPQPVGELISAPVDLTPEQKNKWDYAILNAPKGLLRRLDKDLFLTWVRAATELDEAESHLEKHGKVVKQGGGERTTTDKDGKTIRTVRSDSLVVSPWCRVRDNAFQRMMKATSELGFSPTSRSRITLAGGGQKTANKFANNVARRA